MSIKIFCCYAHEDEILLNQLKRHLKPLQRQGLIDVWHDREIIAGTDWEREISKHLNEAEVILLLVSPDFMASDYCYGKEMQRALERDQRGEAHVIPVILRPVYWQGILGNLQALPTDAEPITSSHWHTLDEAFHNVVEGLLKSFQKPSEQPTTDEVLTSSYHFSNEVIPTGFEDLDRIMGGGFQRSDLIIVGAPPSTGKTSFALNIIINTAIKKAYSVGIFSLEMSRRRLEQRLLSLYTRLKLHLLQTGKLKDAELDQVVYALDEISEAKIWIIDSIDFTFAELQRHALKLVNECKVDLILVDYVNLMQINSSQDSDMSRLLKVMARQLNVTILALVQMPHFASNNRSKVPQLSDIDKSLTKDADIVMFLHREDVFYPESEHKNIANIIVAKHRNGPVGEISLYFRPDIGYFLDLALNTSEESFHTLSVRNVTTLTSQRPDKNKKPDLEKMDQIIGSAQLPDGSILPEGYCIWEGKSYMYLGKLVDGEWLRYGNQGWRWWCNRGDWKGIQKWIAEVNSQGFIAQYGSNNPPLEKNRIYEPKPK